MQPCNPSSPCSAGSWLWTLVITALIAGCTPAQESVRVVGIVGPSPGAAPRGWLVVFTETRPGAAAGDDFSPSDIRESFQVFDTHGRLIADARGARELALEAGDYVVRGPGLSGRLVEVQVQVHAGKTTRVYLDRSRTAAPDAPAGAVVRAPDGSFIGPRAGAP